LIKSREAEEIAITDVKRVRKEFTWGKDRRLGKKYWLRPNCELCHAKEILHFL
jgi:hypothetical protein